MKDVRIVLERAAAFLAGIVPYAHLLSEEEKVDHYRNEIDYLIEEIDRVIKNHFEW